MDYQVGIQLVLNGAAQVEQGLQGVMSSINKMAQGTGIKAVGSVFQNTFGKIGSAMKQNIENFRWASLVVGQYAMKWGKDLLDIAANAEQTKVAFETLLKSPEQASDLMRWIEDFSVKTPMMRSSVEKSARTFLAFGHSLDEAKTATVAISEAVSALGIDETRLNSITLNLGQIFNSTKVRQRELNELNLQGVKVNQLLAKAINEGDLELKGFDKTLLQMKDATGKAAEGVRDLTMDEIDMIQESVLGKEVAIALEKQMIKTYGGASLRQVKTFAGAMSNFGDIFEIVVKRVMGISSDGSVEVGGMFDIIRTKMAQLVEFLANNVDKISNFFGSILKHKEALYGLAAFLGGVFFGFLWGIVKPVLMIGAGFAVLGVIIGKLIEKNGGLTKTLTDIKNIFDKIRVKIEAVNKWFREHQTLIQGIVVFIAGALLPILTALIAKFIVLKAVAVFTAIKSGIMFLISPLGLLMVAIGAIAVVAFLVWKNWDTIVANLRALWSTFVEFWRGIWIAIIDFFVTIWTNLVLFLTTIWTNITTALSLWWNTIALNAQIIWGMIVNTILTWINNAKMWIENVWNAIWTFLTNIWNNISTAALIVWTAIYTTVSGIVTAISTWLSEKWEWIKGIIIAVWESIKDAAGNIWEGIKNAIVSRIQGIIDWVNRAIDKFKEMIGLKDKAGSGGGNNRSGGGSFAHGGIIPGAQGEPVTIQAHGGERVVPRNGVDVNPYSASGGFTVNFYGNVNMDSEDRVRQLADRVIKILGRQNELARYGVYS